MEEEVEKVLIIVKVNNRKYGVRVPKNASAEAIVEYLNKNCDAKIPTEKGVGVRIPYGYETPLGQLQLTEGIVIELQTDMISNEIEPPTEEDRKKYPDLKI